MSRKINKYFKVASILLIIVFAVVSVTIGLVFATKLSIQSSIPYTVISEGAHKKTTFSGSFSPNFGVGRPVLLQVKNNQAWTTVAESSLNQLGKFSFSINTTEGINTYRAAVGNTPLKKLSPEINITTCNANTSKRTSTPSTIVLLDVTGDYPTETSKPDVTVKKPNSTEEIHKSKVYKDATPGLWSVSAYSIIANDRTQFWPIKSQQEINVPKNKCTVIEVNYVPKVPTQAIILTPEQADALVQENPNYQN